jgi:hypothetical protein
MPARPFAATDAEPRSTLKFEFHENQTYRPDQPPVELAQLVEQPIRNLIILF